MHYLIDGYNLLFLHMGGSESLRSKREDIIHILQSKASLVNFTMTVVFDGAYDYGEESGLQYADPIQIAFSPKGQSADDYIIEKISYTFHPADYTVVSSDKGLIRKACELGAQTQNIKSFINWIEKKKLMVRKEDEKSHQDSPENIERLLQIFENRDEKL